MTRTSSSPRPPPQARAVGYCTTTEIEVWRFQQWPWAPVAVSSPASRTRSAAYSGFATFPALVFGSAATLGGGSAPVNIEMAVRFPIHDNMHTYTHTHIS